MYVCRNTPKNVWNFNYEVTRLTGAKQIQLWASYLLQTKTKRKEKSTEHACTRMYTHAHTYRDDPLQVESLVPETECPVLAHASIPALQPLHLALTAHMRRGVVQQAGSCKSVVTECGHKCYAGDLVNWTIGFCAKEWHYNIVVVGGVSAYCINQSSPTTAPTQEKLRQGVPTSWL